MPTLNWIGKDAVVKHHKNVPFRLLEPVAALSHPSPLAGEGLGERGGGGGNLIVQGDNLHALKALLSRYAGQVKCIDIRDDGEVRYNFTAPKQVLEILRAVCQGKTEVHTRLCQLLDEETAHGQNMRRYSALLDQAVAAIAAQFGRKNAGNFFTGRGGKLVGAQGAIKVTTDFELITWLVIQPTPALQRGAT